MQRLVSLTCHCRRKLRLLAGLLLLLGGGLPSGALAQITTMLTNPVVTLVRVKTPWYAAPFLLRRGFLQARPEYEHLPGLQAKYFTYTAARPRYFGGIYLWDSRARAEAWFGPAWFERVRRKRGVEGQVTYYEVGQVAQFGPADPADLAGLRHAVAALLPEEAPEPLVPTPPGLLRRYDLRLPVGQPATILLFATAAGLRAFLAARPGTQAEVFAAPVLLLNQP